MDDQSKKFLRNVDPKRAEKMEKGIEREELKERCREAFEDAGMLALSIFDNDESANAYYVHCQQMIGRLDDLQ